MHCPTGIGQPTGRCIYETAGKLEQITPRSVQRELGESLPKPNDVETAAKATDFDGPRYNDGSTGFRPNLEANLHNQVHTWVGGDMGPFSSPNDPVFFLHHCNVDRIWEGVVR